MNKRSIYSLGLGLSVAAISATTLFSGPTSEQRPAETEQTRQQTEEISAQNIVENFDSASLKIPGVEQTEKGFQFSEEMKERLLSVSEAYEKKIQYPDFSLPIRADELDSKYLPDIPIANETPARLKDPNSPTLSIKPNQYRFAEGDKLTVIAAISGLQADESSSITARLLMNGEAVAHANIDTLDGQQHIYELDFSELYLSDIHWKQELIIETEFMFEGKVYSRGTSIEYISTMAAIEDVASAEIVDEYLNIPVYVATQKPGYHRVRGNLYDRETGEPLVHLRAEGQINSNADILTLKAHISALKAAGSEGPYELRDLSLQRLPSKPDYITEFGKAGQKVYDINGFSFSEYLDKPYVNEKSQRIAKELRRLGT